MARRDLRNASLVALNAIVIALPRLFASRHDATAFVLFLVLASLFCLADASAPDEVPQDQSAGARRMSWLAMLTGVAILAVFWAGLLDERTLHFNRSFIAAGALVMLAGIALRYAAIRTLGDYFVSELRLVDGQPRVRRGVYRWLEHPSEVGLLGATAGAAILLRSPVALGLWLIALVPLTLVRVRAESAFLDDAFRRGAISRT